MANRDFKVRHGLNVCGNSSLGGDVAISGNLDIGGNLSLESADLSGDLQVSGAASFGSLKVAGTTSLQGGLIVDTSLDVQTTLQADAISASGQLQVDGTTSLKDTLTVSGLTSLQGGLVVDTSMDVQSTLQANTISSSGQLIVQQQALITGQTSVGGNLKVTGATTLCSTLEVQGTTTLSGDVQAKGNLSVGGDLIVSGALQVGGSGGSGFSVDSPATFGNTVTISGTTTLCSDLSIGGGGKITISSNTTPHIQLKGDGPHKLRFHDAGTTSQSKALDLVYRTNPNTLGFEKASDETKIWETDVDDLKTTFHEQVLISGTICAGTAIIAGALQVSGGADFHSTLQVSGNASVGGNFSTNTLSVGGSTILSGAVQAKSDISVGGSTILSGDVQAKSDISVGGKLVVGGSTICGSAILASNVSTQFLQVSSNTRIGGVLQVTGSISAPGGIHAAGGDIQTSGTISGTQLKFVSASGQRMTVSNLDSVSGRVGTLSATKFNFTSAGGQRMTISSATITSLNVSTITVNQQGNIARRISGTVASNNSSYVTAFTVTGNNLASCIEVFFEGSIANVVVACYAEIVVNHSGDISIRTHQGQYVTLDVQVISNGDEDFAVLVKRNGGVAGTANLNFNVYPKGDETVTATSTNPYSGTTFTHTGARGTKITATGGNPHKFETDGAIVGGKTLTVSGLTSLQGGLVVDTSMDVQTLLQADTISASGNLTVKGSSVLSGKVTAKSNLSVAGSSILSGAVQAKNTLCVGGSGTIAGVSFDKGWVRIGTADAGIAMDPNEIYFAGAGNLGTLSGHLTLNPAQSIVTSKVFDSTANIQTTAIISGTQLRCTSFAGTTVDVTGTLQVSGSTSLGSLKVAGTTCLQNTTVVNSALQLKSELDFIGGTNGKIIDFTLSSNTTATLRSHDANNQNFHNMLIMHRAGAVELFHNNQSKAATTAGGLAITGTLCASQDVKVAGQLRATGAVSVDGSAHVAQGLQVGGTASINALRVAGATCAQGQAFVNGSLRVTENLTVSGATATVVALDANHVQASGVLSGTQLRCTSASVGGTLVVGGTASFKGALNVSGTLSARKYSFEPYGVVPAYSNNSYQTITYNSAESAIELFSSSDTAIGMAFPAWKVNVNPGNKWQITMQIRASANTTGGVYIRVYEYDAELPNGKIAVSHEASNSLVQEDTRGKALSPIYENQNGSTTWQTLTFEYTPTGSAVWASIVVLNWTGLGTNRLYVREPQINSILENVNVGSNVQVAGHVSAGGYGHFGQALQVSGSASLGSLKVAGTTCLQGQAIAEQLQVHGITSTVQSIRTAAQSQTNANGIGGLAIYSSSISWAGISITGPGATKTLGIHYGGQNDNTLRFGRYQKAASITQGGNYEANPVMFDMDNGAIQTIGQVNAQGDLFCNGQVRTAAQVSAAGDVRAIGQLRSNAQVSVAGGVIAKGGLQVSGTGSFGALKVAGVLSAQGGLVIDSSFNCQIVAQFNNISCSDNIRVDGQISAQGSILAGQTLRAGGNLCGQGNTFCNQLLRVGGTACLQGVAVVNSHIDLKSELNFVGATNKYMDFMLVSSNQATFNANFRSMNHQSQVFHTHLVFNRGAAVDLYHNNNLKAATRSGGFYVSGTLSVVQDVKAGGQIRAAGALSCNGSGHFSQGVQVCGTVSCNGLHAAGGNIQTTGAISGNTVVGQTLQYNTRVNGNNQAQYDKLRVWNNGNYAIGMNNAMTGAHLNDYAMTFTMNNEQDRGFVFRHSGMNKAQYAMAMNVSGRTAIAHGLRVGYGVNWQGDPGTNQIHSAGDVYAGGQLRAAGAVSVNGSAHVAQGLQVGGSISCNGLHAAGSNIQTTGAISGGQLLTGGQVLAGGKVRGTQVCAQAQCLVNNQLRVSQGTILNGTTSIKTANGTTHWNGQNQRRSVVWRNDGGHYYLLITGQQNNANTSWNSWRPFYVSLSNAYVNFRRLMITQQITACGQIQCKGKVSAVCGFGGGGADFAEYFEWADGNPNVSDRVGRSVVVTGSSGKIGIATTGQTPFGVVTGRAAFVGNTAGRWHQRYLKDEYLRTIKDENGNDVPNPEFNSACTYFTREQRAEWDPIGMMGKIPVRVGEPLNPNWMKLRVISPTVEEYLVR